MPEYTPEFEDNDAPASAAKAAAGRFQEQYVKDPNPAMPTVAREIAHDQQTPGKRPPSTVEAPPPINEAPGQQTDAAKPSPPTIANGKFTVTGEAEITTSSDASGSKIILDRLDKKGTGFEMTRSKDGGSITWKRRDPKGTDLTYVITPDGKGGDHIRWTMAGGKEETYHWAPKDIPESERALGPRAESKVESDNLITASLATFDTTGINFFAPTPSEIMRGYPIVDNGQGSTINRFRDVIAIPGQKTTEVSLFMVITSDKQRNQIQIEEGGRVSIANKTNHGLYIFTPLDKGYEMSSTGVPTEDGIAKQSVFNGVERVTGNDGITVQQGPDGRSAVSKIDSNGLRTTWITIPHPNGTTTTRTEKEMPGQRVAIWTHPPYYPKDAYQIEEWQLPKDEGGGIMLLETRRIHDSKNIQEQALTEQEKIEKPLNFLGSRNEDQIPNGDVRNLTLAEAETLKIVLPKFPPDPQKKIKINFFDGWNILSDSTNGFFSSKDNTIGINPRAPREIMLQGNRRYKEEKYRSLEGVIAHEMSHDFTFRLDPQGYNDGTLERKLATIFGMKLAEEDLSKDYEIPGYDPHGKGHKRIWLIEGEELVDGKMQTFYYKLMDKGPTATRCDPSGNPIDKSGKILDPQKEKEFILDISSVAKIKLPTPYAYVNPLEAAAEIWASYGINEASRAYLRETTSEEVYRWVEEADQKIINMVKANEPNPDGWIRVPSGDIRPGNKENKELVLAFMKKHSPGKNNK